MTGVLLYARSRGLSWTPAALAGAVVLAGWAALRTGAAAPDPARVRVLVTLVPVLAAAVIGGSLSTPFDELDRTAVRPWWPRRLAHLLGPAALAGALLALSVLGAGPALGPTPLLRNLLGCTGVTAAAAVVLGARLSWLPVLGYVGAVIPASAGVAGRAVTVWAWPVQPGDRPWSWAAAGTAFVLGTALFAARGARPAAAPR
ncbi:hypothetical protein AB0N31_08275 [Streptomyces sp. NPDC051051]|uniref:hypothetical protein n=1 Tax=Streptomyces sp. NPDC051051 TaxID=3155666 RepID=UPI003438C5E0